MNERSIRLRLYNYYTATADWQREYETKADEGTTWSTCQGCDKGVRGGRLCPECLQRVAKALKDG